MAKTGKSKLGLPCIYCGVNPSTKKGDHAVPRALFLEPMPSDMVTVPACSRCNGEKSELDAYLRDILVSDIHASRNPVARQLLGGKVIKAVAGGHSPFLKAALSQAIRVPIFTASGLYVEDVLSVPVDDRKIRKMFKFMVQGLFYWVKDQPIPESYQYEVVGIRSDGIGDVWGMFEARSDGAGRIGDDVFACRYLFAEEDHFISDWLLVFYNAIAYTVTVVPKGGIQAYIENRQKAG